MLAEIIDLENPESSEEELKQLFSELDSHIDFIATHRDAVGQLKLTSVVPPISSDVNSYDDEQSRHIQHAAEMNVIQQQMSELIQINKDTQNQTQSLLSAHSLTLQHQSQSQSSIQGTIPTHSTKVNLPKLQIPKFSGDVMQWTEFFDMFKSSVHDHQGLSDVQKFTFLRDQLSDTQDTMSGLQLTGSNYSTAMSLLISRFGDKQIIINAHHVALMDLQSASPKSKSLRTLYDSMEIHLRSLSALGQDTTQLVFVPVITNKLPKAVMMQLEMNNGGATWTVQGLRAALCKYISAQEAAERQCPTSTAETDRPTYTSGHVLATHKSATTTPSVTCAFCEKQHYSDECTTYRTVDARKKQAPDRCFKCLRYSHSSGTCHIDCRCFYCGKSGQHHRSFCPSKFGQAHSININAEPFQPTPATSVVLGQDEEVVMQTALVNVLTPSATSVQARVLFDTGSSRSFVTESLQKRAQLPVTDTETISLATFGDHKRRTTEYLKISLQFPTSNGSVQDITACVTPYITSPIRKIAIDTTRHPSRHDLPLAEPLHNPDERLNIDVLIGLNHYYDIVGSDRLVFPDGFSSLTLP